MTKKYLITENNSNILIIKDDIPYISFKKLIYQKEIWKVINRTQRLKEFKKKRNRGNTLL